MNPDIAQLARTALRFTPESESAKIRAWIKRRRAENELLFYGPLNHQHAQGAQELRHVR